MPSRWLFPLLLIAAVAAVVEGMSFATAHVLASRGVLYEAERLDDYAAYLGDRDPLLGWPARAGSKSAADDERDASGSRPIPAFPDPQTPDCATLYGDSFTWGADVSAAEAWSNVLAGALGCRVSNLGVEGYGSDQALLRYRNRAGDRAPVVVLTHLSENVLRNVNQYRALLYRGSLRGFKPRFVLAAGGALELVPLPFIEPANYASFARAPQHFLAHEFFAPGGASGLRPSAFPYSLAVLRAFSHFHVRAKLRGEPWYAAFYRRDHPSYALQVTAEILRTFVREARARGQHPLPVVLPTKDDYAHREATGAWVYAPLVEMLREEGVEVLDAGEALRERFGDEDPSAFFGRDHHNARGNAALAEVVVGWVRPRIAR